MDYCNALLVKAVVSQIKLLQTLQNAVVRLVSETCGCIEEQGGQRSITAIVLTVVNMAKFSQIFWTWLKFSPVSQTCDLAFEQSATSRIRFYLLYRILYSSS